MRKRLLLLSAYDAPSHAYWRHQLRNQLTEFEWTELSLPPRYFNWRIRGNAMQWASTESDRLARDYDLVLATSMVDLASLRGLIPKLADAPSLLYFHENQFAYPAGRQRHDNIEPQIVPLYAALCADMIVFNSAFNRDTCREGVRQLAKRLPEGLPAQLFTKLDAAGVLPVPVISAGDSHSSRTALPTDSPMEIVWNHRWEYDKGIELLAHIIEQVKQTGLRYRFHIVGQQFRHRPEAFEEIDRHLNEISAHFDMPRGNFGYIEDTDRYQALLTSCHVVLSTAKHDFQGLSVQQACLAGCQAAVPDALAYPEYIPPAFRYRTCEDSRQTATAAVSLLRDIRSRLEDGAWSKIDLSAYSGRDLLNRYRDVFRSLINNSS